MDALSLEKKSKEAVVETLKNSEDAPAAAGELARRLATREIIAGVAAAQPPRECVIAVCKGLMAGMLLLEKDLPNTALAILNQMAVVAEETNQDPAEVMTWAMEGIAPVAKLAGEAARFAVQDAIATSFMGAGEIFSKACETAGA
jgi:hypothetical protein